jgi:hypothetical protein
VIVERQAFKTKQGHMDEAIEIMQEMWKLVDPLPHRIYRRVTGPFNTFYQEFEFEDWEHRQKWWAKVGEQIAPLADKWNALIAPGGSSELLTQVE